MRCVFACCCCFLYHFPSFRREGGRREVLAIYRQFWSKMWGSGRRRGGPNYRPGRPASQPTGDCTGYDLAWTWAGQRSEGGGVPHIFLRSPLNLRARSSGNCCAVKFQAGFIEEPLSTLLPSSSSSLFQNVIRLLEKRPLIWSSLLSHGNCIALAFPYNVLMLRAP